MTISPRGSEIAAVQAILESDEYGDARAMARAIVIACAKELQKRASVAVTQKFKDGDQGINVGPFWDNRSRLKYVDEAAKRGLRCGSAFLQPPARSIRAWTAPPLTQQDCATCGHGQPVHDKSWGCYACSEKDRCTTFVLDAPPEEEQWVVP